MRDGTVSATCFTIMKHMKKNPQHYNPAKGYNIEATLVSPNVSMLNTSRLGNRRLSKKSIENTHILFGEHYILQGTNYV